MKVLFSTSSVHPRDRLAFWVEEATKNFVRHEFATPVGRKFHGEISGASLGNMELAAFESDKARLVRSQRHLRFAEDDDVLLFRQNRGKVKMQQDGREALASTGELYILDPRRPFDCSIDSNTGTLVCKIARSEMEKRLGNVGNYTATPISTREPVARLASRYLAMVAAHAHVLEPLAGARISQQAIDLVALGFETVVGKVAQLSSPRATSLVRLKAIIETGSDDPEFKPANAAQAAGISVRYANALLAQEGTSLERYIMLRRLARCREALISPAQSSQSISHIAYSHGFSDLSHFTRRFKEQFGCTPSQIRQKRD